MGKTLLRPIDSASIDEKSYIKTVDESPKQSVISIVKDFLFNKKKQVTLSQVQKQNGISTKSSGIKPDIRCTFDDVIQRVEKDPDKPFSVADVEYSAILVWIISKFNRIPSVVAAIRNLSFHGGINWSAFDTPATYLAKDDLGNYILVSAKGGHRTVKVILTYGFDALLIGRITYIGTLDLEEVCKQAALDHHIDCNKRSNQTADDRIVSGVEAEDFELQEVMKTLIDMKLYVKKELMKPDMIEGFRKVTSWQSLKTSVKNNGFDNTKYAVEKLIDRTVGDTPIISQSVEVVANFINKFKKQIDIVSKKMNKDSMNAFLEWYFSDITRNQSTVRAHDNVEDSTMVMLHQYNLWCQNVESERRALIGETMNGYKNPITLHNVLSVYGDEKNIPITYRSR